MAGLLVEGWPALVNHRLTPATETSYLSPASLAEFPAAPQLTRYSSPPQDASQPVKPRRAMLVSNPLRNSRSETITGATRGSPLLPLLTANVFPMPSKTTSSRIFGTLRFHHSSTPEGEGSFPHASENASPNLVQILPGS